MTDVLTKNQRSYNMSRISGKWTMQEKSIHNYLKGNKIKHKMHPVLFGKPDIFLEKSKIVIFLDGCFWHKCPKCYVKPKTNRNFWRNKIKSNVATDKKVNRKLRIMGYKVIRIWEHEVKRNPKRCLGKLISAVD